MRARIPTNSIQAVLNQLGKENQVDTSSLLFNKSIGEGGFAKVFVCEWNQQWVAVKNIIIHRSEEKIIDKKLNLFCDEVAAMQELSEDNSPNIIKFFGFDITNNYCRIVMEFAPKNSIADLIDKTFLDPWYWEQRYTFIQTAINGLNYLHEKKFIHRDITSDNIFVGLNGEAKIGDFGLTVKQNTKTKNLCGSPITMAPEVISQQIYSEKSDVYSFAIALWEISAWRLLTKNPEEHLHRYEEKFLEFDHPRIANPDMKAFHYCISHGDRPTLPEEVSFPQIVKDTITASWQHNPQNRPSSADLVSIFNSGNFYSESPKIKTFINPDDFIFYKNSQSNKTNVEREIEIETGIGTEIETETNIIPVLSGAKHHQANSWCRLFTTVVLPAVAVGAALYTCTNKI